MANPHRKAPDGAKPVIYTVQMTHSEMVAVTAALNLLMQITADKGLARALQALAKAELLHPDGEAWDGGRH